LIPFDSDVVYAKQYKYTVYCPVVSFTVFLKVIHW